MAMTDLQKFLLESDATQEKEIYLSKRMKDAGFKFKIKGISNEAYSEAQQKALNMSGIEKGRAPRFNQKKFNETIILEGTIEPNFRDADFIKSAGVSVGEQLIDRVLNAGEVQRLVEAILELSGLGESMDELVDEAKN